MLVPDCVFCRRADLTALLAETDNFYLLADHAPLVEGHTLLVPKQHYACFGAIPAALDAEFLALKRRLADFLTAAYSAPAFFEHGVFHQSVYHAHLHAMPFGRLDLPPGLLTAEDAHPVSTPADLRRWYVAHGHYFYLEVPHPPAATFASSPPPTAAVFPPDETRYWQVLAALRHAAQRQTDWHPQPIRRDLGRPLMDSLCDKWRHYSQTVR